MRLGKYEDLVHVTKFHTSVKTSPSLSSLIFSWVKNTCLLSRTENECVVTRYRCNGIIFFFLLLFWVWKSRFRACCLFHWPNHFSHEKPTWLSVTGPLILNITIIRFLLYTALLDYVSAESNGHENIVNDRQSKKLLIVKQSLLLVS